MKLFFFRIGLCDLISQAFYELDGELHCQSFEDAKLVARNLGARICNHNKPKFDMMLLGTVVTEPYLEVEI